MKIKNRKLSVLWKVVLLALGLWGLLDGAGILAGHYTKNFPHMFTNISNIAAWIYLPARCCGWREGMIPKRMGSLLPPSSIQRRSLFWSRCSSAILWYLTPWYRMEK